MARPRPQAWEGPDDDRFDDEEDGPEEKDGDECEDDEGDECEDDEEETGVRPGHGGPAGRGHGQGWHDLGMATAEYAIATLAACGFAGLLLVLLRSSEVRGLLSGIIRRALSVG